MTNLTELLDISIPIVSAPMAGASGGALAAHVSLGGGFGFMAAGYDSVDFFSKQLDLARSILGIEASRTLPIGVGFLGWQLDQDNGKRGSDLIFASLKANVKAVWFAFGKDLLKWIQLVRDSDAISGGRTIVFVQASDPHYARNLAPLVDVLVAQGHESGGHGLASAPPLLTVVRHFLSLGHPCVLAAGGIANGSQVASFLKLGASGVVLGTRFLLTPECLYTDQQRKALVDASGHAPTVRTMAFDHARGTLDWPDGIDGRALRNATVDDFDAKVPLDLLRSNFLKATSDGDSTRMLVWAGTGVSLMSDVVPAKDLVQALHRECLDAIDSDTIQVTI